MKDGKKRVEREMGRKSSFSKGEKERELAFFTSWITDFNRLGESLSPSSSDDLVFFLSHCLLFLPSWYKNIHQVLGNLRNERSSHPNFFGSLNSSIITNSTLSPSSSFQRESILSPSSFHSLTDSTEGKNKVFLVSN